MCFGGGGSTQPRVAKYESKNDAAVITGEQTGVENPKDTKKASEQLKIQREKEEGRYVDPSIATAEKLTDPNRSGGMGAVQRNLRSARLRSGVTRGPNAPSKAQKMAAARRASRSQR